ncbi:hypothetical protein OS493_023437 [Desmophyllum pertusum]|uniref:Uncharacterized protein n=1 Tax=Desmophyllum pertusum TaxID=174260 RepID=A0A9W9ZNM3_9CNID|nr:hypothetical protein OS493_023437 [Desmophyllum pertusum]
MDQVFEDSACRTLVLVRGSKCFSDTTPTAWIKGDCWPPYGEIVTRYPLCGASKLYVYVDCMEGQSTLTFGLISPQERPRYLQFPFIFTLASFLDSFLQSELKKHEHFDFILTFQLCSHQSDAR